MKRTIGIQAEMNVDACVGVMCDMKAHNVGSQKNYQIHVQFSICAICIVGKHRKLIEIIL